VGKLKHLKTRQGRFKLFKKRVSRLRASDSSALVKPPAARTTKYYHELAAADSDVSLTKVVAKNVENLFDWDRSEVKELEKVRAACESRNTLVD
jgi:hypothetical protein